MLTSVWLGQLWSLTLSILHPADLLRLLPYAPQAAFNSYGKDNDDLCLHNTRVEVLQQIRTWVDGDDDRYIFWLSGWAGTGKSTIARTVAREYYDKEHLVASFFFSRGGGEVGHAEKFVASIAMQLAQRGTDFGNLLRETISKDEGVITRMLNDQWKQLVLNPLSSLPTDSFRAPLIIVIDALDECDGEGHINQVLQLLADARSLKRIRFRVLITSRPEIPVRHGFSQVVIGERHNCILHDVSQSIVNHDISVFLEHRLRLIGRERSLDGDWPGKQAIAILTQRAGGLFIWAETVCRYIAEGKRLTAKRLLSILQGDTKSAKPEKELDKIYMTVLKDSVGTDFDEQEKEDFYVLSRNILGAIILLFSPLSTQSLSRLFEIPHQDIQQTLEDLHSILDSPDDSSCPIRLHHPSFRDFLLRQERCSDPHFWVSEMKTHEALASYCIQFMSKNLKGDIWGSRAQTDQSSPHTHRLPAELRYACEYWVQHLKGSELQLQDNDKTHNFLRQHLLYWVEALFLCGKDSEVILAVKMMEDMTDVSYVTRRMEDDGLIIILRLTEVLFFTPFFMTRNVSSFIIDQLKIEITLKWMALPSYSHRRTI